MEFISIRTEQEVKIVTLAGRIDKTTYNTVDQAIRPLAEITSVSAFLDVMGQKRVQERLSSELISEALKYVENHFSNNPFS